ncbi:MAG: hypothetical protein IT522_13840 [Burkholderiales bacterium]|nr:hypothetical protein [Burkholderiales bacterium]
MWTASGAIGEGPLAGQRGYGRAIESATLWAPAITTAAFAATWLPALPAIARFALFTLTDDVERDDDCAGIYHKSLLYLVSNAFEATSRIPLVRPDGEPLVGLQRSVAADARLRALFRGGAGTQWILTPNAQPVGAPDASRARRHGDFDDDPPTVRATLAHVLGGVASTLSATTRHPAAVGPSDLRLASSAQQKRAIRQRLDRLGGTPAR